MTASSVTGVSDPGMSNGEYKPQNSSCRYGCGTGGNCIEEETTQAKKKTYCRAISVRNCSNLRIKKF
jgi:hypothetical protein